MLGLRFCVASTSTTHSRRAVFDQTQSGHQDHQHRLTCDSRYRCCSISHLLARQLILRLPRDQIIQSSLHGFQTTLVSRQTAEEHTSYPYSTAGLHSPATIRRLPRSSFLRLWPPSTQQPLLLRLADTEEQHHHGALEMLDEKDLSAAVHGHNTVIRPGSRAPKAMGA